MITPNNPIEILRERSKNDWERTGDSDVEIRKMIKQSDGECWAVSKAMDMNLGRRRSEQYRGLIYLGGGAYGMVLRNLGFQNSFNIVVGFSSVYSEGFLEANC